MTMRRFRLIRIMPRYRVTILDEARAALPYHDAADVRSRKASSYLSRRAVMSEFDTGIASVLFQSAAGAYQYGGV